MIEMPSSKCFVFFLFVSLLSFLFSFTNAENLALAHHHCPNSTKTFTINSTYQFNLNLLLSSLPSKATGTNGFYNATIGDGPDKVYGFFIWCGNVNSSICQDCVTSATRDVTQRCPLQKEAMVLYYDCFLRYSNEYFFSTVTLLPRAITWNTQNFGTDIKWFYNLVWHLTTDAANEAANSTKKFATRKVNYNNFQTLYSLAECTRDLSSSDCSLCLQAIIADLCGCCSETQGGRIYVPSCYIRFELYPFYYEASTEASAPTSVLLSLPSPASVTRSKGKGIKSTWIAIGTGVAASIVLVLLLGSSLCYMRRYKDSLAERKVKRQALQFLQLGLDITEDDHHSYDILRREKRVESQEFPLDLILEATNHFSAESKLGDGGFGPVYKGITW